MHNPVVVPGIPSLKWDQVRETCVLQGKQCSVVGWGGTVKYMPVLSPESKPVQPSIYPAPESDAHSLS